MFEEVDTESNLSESSKKAVAKKSVDLPVTASVSSSLLINQSSDFFCSYKKMIPCISLFTPIL
jgi:hypothetical protein